MSNEERNDEKDRELDEEQLDDVAGGVRRRTRGAIDEASLEVIPEVKLDPTDVLENGAGKVQGGHCGEHARE